MNIPQIASEIASRIPEMAKDNVINNATVIEGMITSAVEDQVSRDNMRLLSLLAEIREATGDNGQRMQPEFVEYCRKLKKDHDTYLSFVTRYQSDNPDAKVTMCIYCGHTIPVDLADIKKAHEDMIAHDFVCHKNPIASRLLEAKLRLQYISRWRKEAHEYDVDMGHEKRGFDEDTVMEMEAYARQSAKDLFLFS